jgi:CRP/FNR family cyclic AMP-dependent transcriptional regulator
MSEEHAAAKAVAHYEATDGHPVMDREWAEILGELPLFAGLSRRDVGKVAKAAVVTRLAEGATVVVEGDPGTTFFVILDGTAAVEQGGARLRRLGHGDFFGELSLLDGGARTATVIAETPLLAMRLSRGPFLKVLEDEPQIAIAMLRELAGRLRRLQQAS